MAIQSFADREAAEFFVTGKIGKRVPWRQVAKVVRRKLDMLHYAAQSDDLKSPPGNRLEMLHGDLKGFMSIRINDQWRIIFQWSERGPEEVKIVDYH